MDVQSDLRDAIKRDLVAEVARSFGQVSLKVNGTSMLPSVWPGDILTISRRNVADLLPGQIVLCYRNQEFVAHRLARKIGNRLITRGDSLFQYDLPFQEDEVVGQVVSILRNGRCVDPSPIWWHGAGRWVLRRSQLFSRVLLRMRRLSGVKKVAASPTTSKS